jgi:hypothetical protein
VWVDAFVICLKVSPVPARMLGLKSEGIEALDYCFAK